MKSQIAFLTLILTLILDCSKVSCQSSELGKFCQNYLDHITENRTKLSNEAVFNFIKSVNLAESNGSRSNNFGFTYGDLNINSNSKREEYNKIRNEYANYSSYNNSQYLEELALSIPGLKTAEVCIEALKEVEGYRNKSYIYGSINSNKLTLTFWPMAEFGTNELTLEQFDVIAPKPLIVDSSHFSSLNQGMKLNANRSVTIRYNLNGNDCGKILVNYKLSNMPTSKTYSLFIEEFTPLYKNILVRKIEFGEEISRLDNLMTDNDYCVGFISYYLDEYNTSVIAKVNLEIWNASGISNEYRNITYSNTIYTAPENKVLSMNPIKYYLIDGVVGNNSKPGIRLNTSGGNNHNFSAKLANNDIRNLGDFRLYIDLHYGSITYEPSENLLRILDVKIKNRCD